jgi:imidazolonepropionase-like amidohydrolase
MTAPPDLVFTNFSLASPEAGKTFAGASIRMSEGLVVELSTDPSRPVAASANSKTVNLRGKYICPGLIDCHVHMAATPGSFVYKNMFDIHPSTHAYRTTFVVKEMLLRGYTTARDCGGADAALRDAIAEGLLPGPRLFIAGKALSQTGGHGDGRAPHEQQDVTLACCGGHQPALARVVDGVPACLHAARDELRQGANFLKIMCGGGLASLSDPLDMIQFTAEEIQAITTTAANMHTYVTAHAYTPKAIRHAVDNGVMGIEHGNFIDNDTARLCAEKGVIITPTLITYQAGLRPPFDHFYTDDQKRKARQILNVGLNSLKVCKEAGVMMCYGTDLLGGTNFWQNEEFSVRSAVLSPVEILRSATTNAAKLLMHEGKLGTLQAGAFADLLILSDDPLENISVLDQVDRTLLAIIKDGRVVSSCLEEVTIDPLYQYYLREQPDHGKAKEREALTDQDWVVIP